MDEKLIDRWKQVARHLARTTWPGADGSMWASTISRITRLPRDLPGVFDARWSDATSRLASRKGASGVDCVLLRLSHAVATGDHGAVRAIDRAWLASALKGCEGCDAFVLGMGRDAMTEIVPVVDPGAVVPSAVPFALVCEVPRGTGSTSVVVEGMAPLRDAGSEPSGIVARLRTEDGREVALREVDGVPYRALCRPGTWDPIGVVEFATAVSEGVAWRDNPFRSSGAGVTGARERVEAPWEGGRHQDVVGQAIRDALAKAGDLVVIDGVVHRPTGLPMLHLQGISVSDHPIKAGPTRLAFAWSLGDGLTSDSSQTPMPRPRAPQGAAANLWLDGHQPGTADRGIGWKVGDPLARGPLPACTSFPIGDLEQALGLGTALADGGWKVRHDPGITFAAPDRPDAWFDADFFQEDPLASVRSLANLVARHADVGPGSNGLRESAPILALRRALAIGGDLDAALTEVGHADLAKCADLMRCTESRPLVALMGALGEVARTTFDRDRAFECDVSSFAP